MNSRGGRSFDDAYAVADTVPGWLTRDQAAVLHAAAAALEPGATVVEIGSHHGRSAIILAAALPAGARLVAIDPFPDDWRYGAAGTEAACRANLERAGVADRVELRVASSKAELTGWHDPVALAYIDGKHDYWSLRHDLGWGRHVPAGGSVFVHDAFSSLGVTTALLRTLATDDRLVYRGRTGSLARLEIGRPTAGDRLGPWREVPWWLRNLTVKVLLRLRLHPLARLMGHRGTDDPY